MQVKSFAECSKGEHSAILSTLIKLPFVIKISVLSIFEWQFKTGLTVLYHKMIASEYQIISKAIFIQPSKMFGNLLMFP